MADDDGNNLYYDEVAYLCPRWAAILGFAGCVVAVVFASELHKK